MAQALYDLTMVERTRGEAGCRWRLCRLGRMPWQHNQAGMAYTTRAQVTGAAVLALVTLLKRSEPMAPLPAGSLSARGPAERRAMAASSIEDPHRPNAWHRHGVLPACLMWTLEVYC